MKCGTELTEDTQYQVDKAHGRKMCKECKKREATQNQNKQYRSDGEYRKRKKNVWNQWTSVHPDYYRNYMRDYGRSHYLQINGKKVRVNKRPYTNRCEMCGAEGHLGYHHWDDDCPSNGLWLCCKCHRNVETFELPDMDLRREKYLRLKTEIQLAQHS